MKGTRSGARLVSSRTEKPHGQRSVIQRKAHLAGSVKPEFVNGCDGKTAKAVLTAISNTRRGGGNLEDGEEKRTEEATVIQWTLRGMQAENAATYLGKGSHVNTVGRVKKNIYQKAGEDICGWAFTVEEIDCLDTRRWVKRVVIAWRVTACGPDRPRSL